MAAFRPGFHQSLVTKMVEDVFYQRNHLFIWIGKVDQWREYVDDKVVVDQCDCDCPVCENKNGTLITVEYGDGKNPHRDPDSAYANEITMRDNIAYVHKISANDISVVAPNHVWKYDTVYTAWDDTKDMTRLDPDHPFYCVNKKYQVFKCLNTGRKINKDGTYTEVPSKVEPEGVSYDTLRTTDGYVWKYLFTVPLTKRSKFYNSKWLPVQKAIETTFYNRGAIEQIIVQDGGSGYSSDPRTLITVNAPQDVNGVQAQCVPIVNPDTGSIEAVFITEPGSGYLPKEPPAITVLDYSGRGQAKYPHEGGHTKAVLKAHITDDGKLGDVSIEDPGINYPADTATQIVVTGDGEGCTAYPKIVNGKIEGVVITNPGIGYTFADVKAVCNKNPYDVQPAQFTTKIGGEIQINEQSVVEQLAIPGAIYNIEMTKAGADYTGATEVIIEGDGEGCVAHAEIEGGSVVRVIIDNPGKNYTRAKISFKDVNRREPNPNPAAEAYAILPPSKGHGFNAVEELYGQTVANYVVVRSDNLLAQYQQEFRQFGIIENLRTVCSQVIVPNEELVLTFNLTVDPPSTISGNLKNDSIVYIGLTPYRVFSMYNTQFMLQQMSSIYRDVNPGDVMQFTDPITGKRYSYPIISVENKPEADKYSGTMLYSSNNTPFYMTDNKTLAIRTYIKL